MTTARRAAAAALALTVSIAIGGCGASDSPAPADAVVSTSTSAPASESYADQVARFTAEVGPHLDDFGSLSDEVGTHMSNLEIADARSDIYLLQDEVSEMQAVEVPDGFPGADHWTLALDLYDEAYAATLRALGAGDVLDVDVSGVMHATDLLDTANQELNQASAEIDSVTP